MKDSESTRTATASSPVEFLAEYVTVTTSSHTYHPLSAARTGHPPQSPRPLSAVLSTRPPSLTRPRPSESGRSPMHSAIPPRPPPIAVASDGRCVNTDVLQSINRDSTVDAGPSTARTRKRVAELSGFDPIVRSAKRTAVSNHERRGDGACVDRWGVIARVVHFNDHTNGRGSIQIV